ncbi:hypothetical protein HK100_008885 [Physocladia obscura]|uniref:Bacterial surface antigen (D15) domain-containing protein n=1 Tax=Physocladia obscura TaxID=109957 RepID=A0AAD5SNT2_9FUNG|nr:hypothetical protein HK100_008885 [Physocladia obscura]
MPIKGHFFANAGNMIKFDDERNIIGSTRKLFDSFSTAVGLGLAVRFSILRLEINYCFPISVTRTDGVKSGLQFGVGLHFTMAAVTRTPMMTAVPMMAINLPILARCRAAVGIHTFAAFTIRTTGVKTSYMRLQAIVRYASSNNNNNENNGNDNNNTGFPPGMNAAAMAAAQKIMTAIRTDAQLTDMCTQLSLKLSAKGVIDLRNPSKQPGMGDLMKIMMDKELTSLIKDVVGRLKMLGALDDAMLRNSGVGGAGLSAAGGGGIGGIMGALLGGGSGLAPPPPPPPVPVEIVDGKEKDKNANADIDKETGKEGKATLLGKLLSQKAIK